MFRVLKQLLRSTAGDVVVLEWVTQQIYGYICTPLHSQFPAEDGKALPVMAPVSVHTAKQSKAGEEEYSNSNTL